MSVHKSQSGKKNQSSKKVKVVFATKKAAHASLKRMMKKHQKALRELE